jgi:hypothetical protein
MGTILWSWHIWVVDFDPVATQQTYISGAVMMDRNLGALNVVLGDVGSLGLMYQWGRKDPFVGSDYISAWDRAYTAPLDVITYVYYDSSNDTIENAIKNPTVVYNDARWDNATDLWGVNKTKYDPCPVGWRVPDRAAWDGLNMSDFNQLYLTAAEPYSVPTAYFPTTGYTDGEECIYGVRSVTRFWITDYRRMIDMDWDRNPSYEWKDIDSKHSVRCMKDDPNKDGSNEGYTGSDYEW